MEWTKIDRDSLPEDDQTCFVHVSVLNSGYTMIDTFNDHDSEKWIQDYTHFMPLNFPKPPMK